MKITITISCLLSLVAAVTPVQKTVQMLEAMIVNAKAAKHEENVQFAGFKQFCDDVKVSKTKDIKDADGQIELLQADVEKANSEVERLGKEVGGHQKEITGWEKDAKDATKVRTSEHATYMGAHLDYTESIQALGHAIIVLKSKSLNAPAKSLLQKVAASKKTTENARHAIEAFLDRTSEDRDDAPDPDDNLGYKATAYKPQSGAIITMLEKLKDQFKDELRKLEKTEVARRQTYDMLSQDLESQRTDATNAIQEKSVNQAKNKQLSIEKAAGLADVTGVRKVDAKYLADLTSLYGQKSAEFEARTKLREDEIEALTKAVEILASDEVSSAKKHLPSLLQARGAAFAQLRASTLSPGQMRAAAFLRDESVRLGSHILSSLAMEARADPLLKVKSLIEELIKRLLQEATNEASHKGWCDKEKATNKHTRESKSVEVDSLTSTIEGLESDIKSIKKDMAVKTKAVAEIEAAVAEFTGKRRKETAANAATTKEAQEGQKAIVSAIKVLEDFYAAAAKPTKKAASLAQGTSSRSHQPEIPSIFDSDFKGQQSAKGGVIGMLQVVQSDFARLEADTKSAETAAQSEYDAFMSDSAQTKASLQVDLKHSKTSQLSKEGELSQAKDNLESSQKTLTSAKDTYEKLKEPCLGGGQTYAERKARRKDEIDSLKEALRILSGDDIAALQERME